MSVSYKVKTKLEVTAEVATKYFERVCELLGWSKPTLAYGLLSTKVRDGKFARATDVKFNPRTLEVSADSDYQELVDVCNDIPNYMMMVDIQTRLKENSIDSEFVFGADGTVELKLPESIQGVEAFDLV